MKKQHKTSALTPEPRGQLPQDFNTDTVWAVLCVWWLVLTVTVMLSHFISEENVTPAHRPCPLCGVVH